MAMERRYFRSFVENRRDGVRFRTPKGTDMWIQFNLYRVTRSCLLENPSRFLNGPQNFITYTGAFVCLSDIKKLSQRSRYTQAMAERLSLIHVPAEAHAAIIEKLFPVIEEAAPMVDPIYVDIYEVTLRYLDNAADVEPLDPEDLFENTWYGSCSSWIAPEDQGLINEIDAMQSTGIYGPEPKLIPATQSFIEGLDKVTFDGLESTVRQMPCSICMESLDHFALEQGTDQQQMITRLPCSHLYHEDCVVEWLGSNHMCPLCRYPMPTVKVRMEAGEEDPSDPSPLWKMLMISAGGVLATATCFALQMGERKLKMNISDYVFYAVPLVALYSAKLW